MKFSAEQRDVINLESGWHACLAPAGSGKTEILTERVSRAIETGIDPADMLCLTFTNRAARSMTERIEKRLGTQADGIFIGNTHAFALQMLKCNQLLPPTNALADEETVKSLWSRAMRQSVLELLIQSPERVKTEIDKVLEKIQPLKISVDSLSESQLETAQFRISTSESYLRWNLKALSSLVQPLLSPNSNVLTVEFVNYVRERLFVADANISERDVPFALGLALLIFERYKRDKAEMHLYDFDDLLVRTWETLSGEGAAKMRGYSWCQIDEVQDLSPLQWLIVKGLLSKQPHVLLLGDIRQSIYRFLGASVEVTEHYLGGSKFNLTKNYRSPANLVEMADAYCQHHFGLAVKTESEKPARDAALVHINRTTVQEHDNVLIRHARKLASHHKSVAILCPTNKQVETYSKALECHGLAHFRIDNQDLFSREHGLDFMAFLNALYNPRNRMAWSRLLWRFGDLSRMSSEERRGDEPQIAAMRLAAKLGALGCDIPDFLGGDSCFDYFLRRFHRDAKGSVTFFDTETTGLDPKTDAVIQLAGVRVVDDQIVDEIDLYCQTDQPLGDSVKVHHITPEILAEKGLSAKEQLARFLSFSKGTVLAAHNLSFDDAMLRSHLSRCTPDLYAAYDQAHGYCTLEIAKRLYPELPKHKLGILLDHFGLEGVNSHNALDDVKAGAFLMKHLSQEVEQRLGAIDNLVTPFAEVLERFNRRFSPLWGKAQNLKKAGENVSISLLLDLYFGYVEKSKGFKVDEKQKNELGIKLGNHAKANFQPAPMADFLEKCMSFYQTAKESDLLTDNDYLVVSTIHRAKGLEFQHVILPKMVDGVMPSFWVTKQLKSNSIKVKQEAGNLLEEQKRLTYVALTRAKDQLVLGSFNTERGYDKTLCQFLHPVLHLFKSH